MKPLPLANSLAATTVIFYFTLYMMSIFTPRLFRIVFNSQFLGANVASLYPETPPVTTFLITLVAIASVAWLFGFLLAWLYQQFDQPELS